MVLVARTRVLLLAPVMVLLSLSMVIMSGQHDKAAAWASAPTPVQLAGALKSPPARIISWTPQGRVVMVGIGLAMLAYQTKDSWWPTAQGWFTGEPEPAVTLGGFKLYSQGNQSPQVKCDATSAVIAKTPTTTGTFTGWNALRIGFDLACTGPGEYPNYGKPGLTISAVSLCRNLSSGAYAYRSGGATGEGPGGLGTKVVGAPPMDRTFNYVIDYPIQSNLCQGVSNEIPVQTTFGLGAPSGSPRNFPIVDIDGVNAGSPEAKDWGQAATVRCRKDDGTFITVTDTLFGNDKRLALPSCAERVPGSIPWDGSISHGPRAGTGTTLSPNATTPIGTFATNQDLFNEWRDCFGPTGVTCKTEVYVDGQRCVIGRSECVNWSHIYRGEPERVQCRFGSHIVRMADCQPLRKAYGTRTIVVTDPDVATEIDTSLDTETDPAPAPTTPPNPNPTTNPNPQPTSPPTTGPNPTIPGPVTDPTTDPDSRSCYGEAWSWNPIDWVYVPVKCAFKWAFVPRATVLDGHMADLSDSAQDSTLGNYLGVFQSMAPATASGCEGPALPMGPLGGTGTAYPISACGGAMATAATASRLIIGIGVALSAGFACVRILGRGIGWDPGLGGQP